MLKKALKIEGIGLLRNVEDGAKNPFQKATLLYGENGRGKSTLTNVLRSCSTRNSDLIEDRVTIDANVSPSAKLLFTKGTAEFKNRTWTGYTPKILTYDGDFVAENVHAGTEITTNQRANLLTFALGTSAVQAREQEEQAKLDENSARAATKQVREKLEALVAGRMPIPQFRAIQEDSDIDRKIVEAEKRLDAIKRSAEIKRLPLPQECQLPNLDINRVFETLNETLESVHETAAAKVSEHLDHLTNSNSTQWLQDGLELAQDETCPFCGQNTSGNELIKMYQIFFDRAYTELQERVNSIAKESLRSVDPENIQLYSQLRGQNNAMLQQWSEFVAVAPVSGEQDELARLSLENLRQILESLFSRKSSEITEAHGTDSEKSEALQLWETVQGIYNDENSVIRGYREAIDAYKRDLDYNTADDSRAQLERLRLTKVRYTQSTKQLISEALAAENELKNAESAKKLARETLNDVMKQTLGKFKDSINDHLDKFNADFRIAEIGHNYRGGTPRAEYQIKLRGESIELNGGRPTFATALSEGDKKTMGFAFFAASTLSDPDLGEKIVVIDDPMSSLDAPRRDHTIEVIQEISSEAEQVILLAHDEHFLRMMRESLRKQVIAPQIAEIQLRRAPKKYTDFAPLDLDTLCQSDYLADYKLVSGVADGTVHEADRVAHGAVALRTLLEGYLHRKYPGAIPIGVTLGDAISTIEEKSKVAGSPCASMGSRIVELRELNKYAGKFHHNTQPDMVAARKEPQSAIAMNAEKILSFIHSA